MQTADIRSFWSSYELIEEDAARRAGRASLREFLHPQIGRPLCLVFARAGDPWPQRVIAADLLHEELGAGGVHLVPEASDPIRMHQASVAA
jgi:hypothetical protein